MAKNPTWLISQVVEVSRNYYVIASTKEEALKKFESGEFQYAQDVEGEEFEPTAMFLGEVEEPNKEERWMYADR